MIELRLAQRKIWPSEIGEEYKIVLDNQSIGIITIAFSRNSSHHSEIGGFMIYDESNQNKGYGTEAFAKIMKKLPAHVPIDLAVWKTNDRARHIYEKAGFRIIDKGKGYNKDVYYMTKNNN